MYRLDPDHTSCVGGRTVLTCRDCAGNPPRDSICRSCNGRGFNIFACAHCTSASAGGIAFRSSNYTCITTPESSVPSSPALSRSSSLSVSPAGRFGMSASWKRFGMGETIGRAAVGASSGSSRET